MRNRAVFIDRDGTINEDVSYIDDPGMLKLIPGSAEAIRLINEMGFKVIVVTNQSGVARGLFPESMVGKVNDRMEELLTKDGAKVDAIYYCPHHPTEGKKPYRTNCECRKPKSGMIDSASKDLDIDPDNSYMVGDKITDIEFVHTAGTKGILVKTGYGKGELEHLDDNLDVKPDYIAEDLLDAVHWIVKKENSILRLEEKNRGEEYGNK